MNNCYKCKKIFGSSDRIGTVEGQKYCADCLKCHKCRQEVTAGNFNRKNGDFWCLKCLDEDKNDKCCSFCGKKATKFSYVDNDPSVIACMNDKCRQELKKPKNYDPDAKAYCQCGKKTSTPTWKWNGNEWEACAIIVCGGVCKQRERAKLFAMPKSNQGRILLQQ